MVKQQKASGQSKRAIRHSKAISHLNEDTSIWTEALFGAEVLLLHATPVYYGFGVRRGDGSAVVIIPGFLGTDLYLMELHGWLERIGYRPYFSGIGINAECPNLLVERHLNETVKRALRETGRKIHLIGHSLGGVIARSIAGAEAERHRFRHHAGFADSRHRSQPGGSSRGGGGSFADPE